MSDNKKTPYIRFSGFVDDWEQCKLTEAASLFGGLTYSPNNIVRENGTLVLRSSNVKNGEVVDADNVYVDSEVVNVDNVRVGDIIVVVRNGSRSLIGKHGQVKVPSNNTVIGAFMSGLRAEHPEFINALLDTKLFKEEIDKNLGATINQITNGMFKQMNFLMPGFKEQDEIGRFFKKLDKLITLHQRKYDKLLLMKKSMLEKMFAKKGEVVPEIRFSSFLEDWDQRKLEDYLAVSSDKNTEDLYGKSDVLSVSGEFGIVNQIKFQGRSFAGASVSNYGVVCTGDVVYTKSPLKSNPYGIIKTNKGCSGIVSTLYAVYNPKENTFPDFVQTYFEHHARMNNYMQPLVNKGAKNDMKVSSENALKGFVVFPSIDEQKAISSYFNIIDNLIILHQRKSDKLKIIKKSILDKMFV